MKLKYLNGLILVSGRVRKNNKLIKIEKVFYSKQELLEFWSSV
jgi:hypothetical protein